MVAVLFSLPGLLRANLKSQASLLGPDLPLMTAEIATVAHGRALPFVARHLVEVSQEGGKVGGCTATYRLG